MTQGSNTLRVVTCGGQPAGANAASPGSHGTGAPVVHLLHDGRKTERGLGRHVGRPRRRPLRRTPGVNPGAPPLHHPDQWHGRLPRGQGG
jgi:hypothetical protein